MYARTTVQTYIYIRTYVHTYIRTYVHAITNLTDARPGHIITSLSASLSTMTCMLPHTCTSYVVCCEVIEAM